MFIDLHVHTRIFETPRMLGEFGSRFATPEELRQKLGPLGVRAVVALPQVSPECASAIQSVEEILEAAARYPDFVIPFMNIDPRQNSNAPDADLSHQMRYYRERGCRGIGEVTANLPFDDPMMENLFRHAEANGLPLLFHIAPENHGYYGIRDLPGLPLLEGALGKFPELTFIGHSQPFWAEISGDLRLEDRNSYPTGPVAPGGAVVRLMREHPNLHADLSAGSGFNAISRDPEFGYGFLTEFAGRLYFGTDVCDPRNDVPLPGYLDRAVAEGAISCETYEMIGWRNAERLLGL
jgi:uncharacterized protein